MFKRLFNIIDYLNLKDVGILEISFALVPMLQGRSLGSIPMSALLWVILLLVLLFRDGSFKPKNFRPLAIFVGYWFLHEFVMSFIDDTNLNSIIVQLLVFASVFILYPSLNIKKMRGSFNWIALISIGGLLYQWASIARGVGVHPLDIPGFTLPESRLEELTLRPSSYYTEPAAYVSFMLCPLVLALIDKKYIWVSIMILSIYLTTSTTGIVLSFVILIAYLLSKKVRFEYFLVIGLLGVAMVYSLNEVDAFSFGVEKLEGTDATTNVRLSQGPKVVSSMQGGEYILGVPYSTAYNYCKSGRMTDVHFYGQNVYMSTFWNILLCYGVIGLLLYLNIYYKLFRKSRLLWPILICLLATMFSDPDGFGPSYCHKLIFMLAIATNGYHLIANSKKY